MSQGLVGLSALLRLKESGKQTQPHLPDCEMSLAPLLDAWLSLGLEDAAYKAGRKFAQL